MSNKELLIGKDAYKYEKIYQKQGVFRKVRRGRVVESSWKNASEELRSMWEKYGGGRGNYEKHLKDVYKLEPTSILDVGCGWNSFVKEMKETVDKAVGVDFACPGADVIASAHDMPFEDNSYDLITSWDCMEHIPEEEVPLVMKEFSRIADRIYIKICTGPTKTKIDGEDLHVCMKEHEWWDEQVEKHFKIETSVFEKNRTKPEKSYVLIHGTKKKDED